MCSQVRNLKICNIDLVAQRQMHSVGVMHCKSCKESNFEWIKYKLDLILQKVMILKVKLENSKAWANFHALV